MLGKKPVTEEWNKILLKELEKSQSHSFQAATQAKLWTEPEKIRKQSGKKYYFNSGRWQLQEAK